MSEPRYRVQSEHVRDEPRVYWVMDLKAGRFQRGYNAVTGATIYKRHAERECAQLNAANEQFAERATYAKIRH